MDVDAEEAAVVEDLYSKMKTLQRRLEFVDIQEEYVKDEQRNLKRELLRGTCRAGLRARAPRPLALTPFAPRATFARVSPRVPPRSARGGQAHPVCPARDWAVSGDD